MASIPLLTDLSGLLTALTQARIGVIGDFCLDAYWELDETLAEISIETGLPTRAVRAQRYAPGAAGTIVNNLVAMGVPQPKVFGVVGDDLFGRELRRLLCLAAVDDTGLVVQEHSWDTPVYLKPIRKGKEENRLDLGLCNQLDDAVAIRMVKQLGQVLTDLDVVIINQQFARGIHTPLFHSALEELIRQYPHVTFLVDGRHPAGRYAGCFQRLNEREAAQLCGRGRTDGQGVTAEAVSAWAEHLHQQSRLPVFISRGECGVVVADATGVHPVPGLLVSGPVDPVGAGDSMLAGIAGALAAGRSALEAAVFGNLVAAVTVQKLHETGTASPEEILALGSTPNYGDSGVLNDS